MKLGDKLKEIRTNKDLSVSESAEGAYISKNYLQRIERNTALPSFPVLYNLADYYEVDLDDLLKLHPRYTGKVDTVFDRVKDLAIRQGLHLSDISEAIGVHASYFHSLKNVRNPHEDTIHTLAKALGTTEKYLLEGLK